MIALPLIVMSLLAGAPSAPAAPSRLDQALVEVDRLWGSDAPRMRCVLALESTGTRGQYDPGAINWADYHPGFGRGSFGLGQLGIHWVIQWLAGDWRRALDPVVNVRLARRVWLIQGWNAWSTARRC